MFSPYLVIFILPVSPFSHRWVVGLCGLHGGSGGGWPLELNHVCNGVVVVSPSAVLLAPLLLFFCLFLVVVAN